MELKQHTVKIDVYPERNSEATFFWALCSCGWRSLPVQHKQSTQAAADFHARVNN